MQTLCSDTVALVDSYRRAVMVQKIDGSIPGLPKRRPKNYVNPAVNSTFFDSRKDKAVNKGRALPFICCAGPKSLLPL